MVLNLKRKRLPKLVWGPYENKTWLFKGGGGGGVGGVRASVYEFVDLPMLL